MKWVTEFVAKVQFHLAASERVFEVLDTPTHPRTPTLAALPLQPRPLTLKRVGFGRSRPEGAPRRFSAGSAR